MRVGILLALIATGTALSAQQSPIPALHDPGAPHPTELKESSAPPDTIPLLFKEISFLRASRTHDLVALRSILLPDFIFIGEKIEDREQILGNIDRCALGKSTLVHPRELLITPDIAIVTYSTSQGLACVSLPRPNDVNVSSTWVKREGQWLLQARSETPIAAN
jgi:hypothetical protein